MDGEKKKLKFSLGTLILAFWVVLLLQQLLSTYLQPARMSYTDFKGAVVAGRVEDVAVGRTLIRGHFKPQPAAQSQAPSQAQPAAPFGAPSQAQPPAPTPPPSRSVSAASFETGSCRRSGPHEGSVAQRREGHRRCREYVLARCSRFDPPHRRHRPVVDDDGPARRPGRSERLPRRRPEQGQGVHGEGRQRSVHRRGRCG